MTKVLLKSKDGIESVTKSEAVKRKLKQIIIDLNLISELVDDLESQLSPENCFITAIHHGSIKEVARLIQERLKGLEKELQS